MPPADASGAGVPGGSRARHPGRRTGRPRRHRCCDDGITILAWAAIANRVDMARLLIERGADVNHVDKKGMTPLLYAAAVDFGDSAMIDLLVKHGAQANSRTKEGQTALDLARQYKHTHLLASLEAPRASQ